MSRVKVTENLECMCYRNFLIDKTENPDLFSGTDAFNNPIQEVGEYTCARGFTDSPLIFINKNVSTCKFFDPSSIGKECKATKQFGSDCKEKSLAFCQVKADLLSSKRKKYIEEKSIDFSSYSNDCKSIVKKILSSNCSIREALRHYVEMVSTTCEFDEVKTLEIIDKEVPFVIYTYCKHSGISVPEKIANIIKQEKSREREKITDETINDSNIKQSSDDFDLESLMPAKLPEVKIDFFEEKETKKQKEEIVQLEEPNPKIEDMFADLFPNKG